MLFEIQTRICKILQQNSDPRALCNFVSTPWPEISESRIQNMSKFITTISIENIMINLLDTFYGQILYIPNA